MPELKLIIPITILLISFLYKLFVDRNVDKTDAMFVLLSFPFDIQFLGLSFVSAYTIAKGSDKMFGVFCILLYIVSSVVVTVLWRRSSRNFDAKKFRWSLGLWTCNFLMSSFLLYYSTNLLVNI